MEKSVKIALVGFLIVLAYATIVFFDTGFLTDDLHLLRIVPIPLFSYLLFGVVVGSMVQDKLNIKSYVPLLTLVVLRCIGNPFTYTFFLDEAAYDEFNEGLTLSLFRILETLSVFPLVILTVGFKGIQQKITALALCSVYILTLIPPLELLNYSFFTLFVLTLIYLKNKHLTIPALVLLAIFDLLQGYSVLFA